MDWIQKLFDFMLVEEAPAVYSKTVLKQMKALYHWPNGDALLSGVKAERHGAQVESYSNQWIVSVDPSHFQCNTPDKLAWALLHEIGHIVHGHVDLDERSRTQRIKARVHRIFETTTNGNSKDKTLASDIQAYVAVQASAREEDEASRFADERINQWAKIARHLATGA